MKRNGLFGFISNTFDKTKAANKLRDYLSQQKRIIKYIDFTEVQIFNGATTYPIILIAKNNIGGESQFSYIKIPKQNQSKVIDIEHEPDINVIQKALIPDGWNFYSVDKVKVLEKIKAHKTIREKFNKCYYGIKTGFNDAFIIDEKTKIELEYSHPSSKELIKPFYEGKDLYKWRTPHIEKYIIFTRRGTMIEKYPAIKDYLEIFRDRLEPRNTPEIKVGRKPGPYKWFEIQDSIEYYKIFEEAKITWPNLQVHNKFSFDDKGYYINAPSVVFPSGNKILLCILNSKVAWFFLKSICVVRSGGYLEVKPQYFEQIPIPELTNKEVFDQMADRIINTTIEFHRTVATFSNLLQSKFDLEKLSKKLQNWHELEFGEILKELEKARKIVAKTTTRDFSPLPLAEQSEWMQYFNAQKGKAQELKKQIDQTDKEIDKMVYDLYGLTDEEIRIVEQG